MKILFRLLTAGAGLGLGFGLLFSLPAGMLFVAPAPPEPEVVAGGRYACPMMDFIGTRPGTCPVCGMTMGLVEAGEITLEQSRRMELDTTVVTEGPASLTVRAYGRVEFDERFTRLVIPRVSGRIVHRHETTFGCCQMVEEGSPIIDLYSPEVIEAQGELRAAANLGDEALVTGLREKFARWNLAPVAAAVLQGGPLAEVVTITSPFAGQVLLREVEMANESLAVGREVADDSPLLRLVDPEKRVVILQVPESRAHWVREGQSVRLASDDQGPLTDLKATVDRVAEELDPTLRTREVRLYLDGVRRRLSPGSLVQAQVDVRLAPDLTPADPNDPDPAGRFVLVPKEAVLSTGVRHVAWRVAERTRDRRLRFEPVSLALGPRLEGADGQDLYVVRGGLKVDDVVATRAAFLIDSQAQLAGSTSLLQPLGAGAATAPAHAH
jgi:Cu(I)/Ag(I) efflux system membrane fusion protein